MHLRSSTALVISILAAGLLAGCGGDSGPSPTAETERLKTELDATKQKLTAVQAQLAAKTDEVAKSSAANFLAETAKKETVAADQSALKDAQIATLQKQLADLKKSEANAYAAASATQAKGITLITLDRYQQFVRDYPDSSLVADANRAIAELTATRTRETAARNNLIDAKRPERDVLQHFNDRIATVEELGPLLKTHTPPEVIRFLGLPNKTLNSGAELAYENRILDPATGNKETLVIIFEEGHATTLRIGYTGREIKP